MTPSSTANFSDLVLGVCTSKDLSVLALKCRSGLPCRRREACLCNFRHTCEGECEGCTPCSGVFKAPGLADVATYGQSKLQLVLKGALAVHKRSLTKEIQAQLNGGSSEACILEPPHCIWCKAQCCDAKAQGRHGAW